jgi:hypothetical protein
MQKLEAVMVSEAEKALDLIKHGEDEDKSAGGKKEALKKDLARLFSKINWGMSAIDADAIAFMNEIGKRIDDL